MGSVEAESKRRAKKVNMQRAVLNTLLGLGVVSMSVLAPKILKLLPRDFAKPQTRIRRCVSRLKDMGCIVFEKTAHGTVIRLTERGRAALVRRSMDGSAHRKKQKWDGKWRVVIYDIGEKRKKSRVKLRQFLVLYGFKRLQDSVWVYPYDCEEVIVLMKADFKIGKDLLYMIVDAIENDTAIRRAFNLPV